MKLVIRKEPKNSHAFVLQNAYSAPIPTSKDKFKDLVNL